MLETHPEMRDRFRFQLEVIEYLDGCASANVTTAGDISVFFNFLRNEQGLFEVDSIEPIVSALTPLENRRVFDCLAAAAKGLQVDFPRQEEDTFGAATNITFPLFHDRKAALFDGRQPIPENSSR